jgi:hypothetical protein
MAIDARNFKRLKIPVIFEMCSIVHVKYAFTDVAEQNTPELTCFDSSTARQTETKIRPNVKTCTLSAAILFVGSNSAHLGLWIILRVKNSY